MSSEYHFADCKWLPANHFLFQIANVCLMVSYLAPDSLNGLFMLRAALGLGGLFFALWGWWVLCAPDTFVWNLLFMIFNFAHLAYMVFKVKRPRRFSEEADHVYKYLFEPLGVEPYQFQKLANMSSAKTLAAKQFYGKEDQPAEKISILLSGRVEVRKGGKLLHSMRQYDFIDSPEWATFRPGEVPRFGVTLMAMEDSVYLTWDSCELRRALKTDAFMKNVFNSLIGQDVTNKLLHLDQNFEGPPSSNFYANHEYASGYIASQDTESVVDEADSPKSRRMEKMPLLKVTPKWNTTSRNGEDIETA